MNEAPNNLSINSGNDQRRASTGSVVLNHLDVLISNSHNANSNSNSNSNATTSDGESRHSTASTSPASKKKTHKRAKPVRRASHTHETHAHSHGKTHARTNSRGGSRRSSLNEMEQEAQEVIHQVRRYSDSYIDFRPAAALAGLYPRRVPAPLHLPHDSVWRNLLEFSKNKVRYFWHGQSSMITGTGLITTDYTKVHISTKIITVLLTFGGSPLTVILPITLVIRKHCEGPKPRAALMRLFKISLAYYILFIIIPFLIYSFYLLSRTEILDGVNPFWFGIFHSISAFTNSGITLYSDSLVRFAADYLINLLTALQVLFGYMAVPLALRFSIWVTTFIPWIDKKPSIMLLKTPAFAGYLFPKIESQIITIVIVLIVVFGTLSNLIEWDQSLKQLTPPQKVLAAFFNDVTTRNAGFATIDFSANYEVTNIIAMYWMYIAGYPVGVRISRSLQPHVLGEYVGFYLKKFLVSGKWWLAITLLVITLVERNELRDDPDFTFFKVIFELISAYGTVGLSLGYRGLPYSFCGVWKDTSKIALILIMFIGRHRRLKGTLLNSVQEANTIGSNLSNLNNEEEIV